MWLVDTPQTRTHSCNRNKYCLCISYSIEHLSLIYLLCRVIFYNFNAVEHIWWIFYLSHREIIRKSICGTWVQNKMETFRTKPWLTHNLHFKHHFLQHTKERSFIFQSRLKTKWNEEGSFQNKWGDLQIFQWRYLMIKEKNINLIVEGSSKEQRKWCAWTCNGLHWHQIPKALQMTHNNCCEINAQNK